VAVAGAGVALGVGVAAGVGEGVGVLVGVGDGVAVGSSSTPAQVRTSPTWTSRSGGGTVTARLVAAA
jgi:hypothetical protein